MFLAATFPSIQPGGSQDQECCNRQRNAPFTDLKPGPHQQQCRSNIVEYCKVECCFVKVERCFYIVAGVDRPLHIQLYRSTINSTSSNVLCFIAIVAILSFEQINYCQQLLQLSVFS